MINFIDKNDIQVKNVRDASNPNNDNKIRKSWVLATTDETKAVIKSKIKDAEARWAFYKSIDDQVSEEWVNLMKKHTSESIKSGSSMIFDKIGGQRLEDQYCIDADEQLIVAGQNVAEELAETFTV